MGARGRVYVAAVAQVGSTTVDLPVAALTGHVPVDKRLSLESSELLQLSRASFAPRESGVAEIRLVAQPPRRCSYSTPEEPKQQRYDIGLFMLSARDCCVHYLLDACSYETLRTRAADHHLSFCLALRLVVGLRAFRQMESG